MFTKRIKALGVTHIYPGVTHTFTYKPNRGGHAPGHIREAFLEALEEDKPVDRKLIGLLWNCTDVLPSDYCWLLDMRRGRGRSYACAVRKIRAGMEENS